MSEHAGFNLLIAYDPEGRLGMQGGHRIKVAGLSLADGLEGRDIYEVARRLAELLLEQMQ